MKSPAFSNTFAKNSSSVRTSRLQLSYFISYTMASGAGGCYTIGSIKVIASSNLAISIDIALLVPLMFIINMLSLIAPSL